jgi:hypothetical protein
LWTKKDAKRRRRNKLVLERKRTSSPGRRGAVPSAASLSLTVTLFYTRRVVSTARRLFSKNVPIPIVLRWARFLSSRPIQNLVMAFRLARGHGDADASSGDQVTKESCVPHGAQKYSQWTTAISPAYESRERHFNRVVESVSVNLSHSTARLAATGGKHFTFTPLIWSKQNEYDHYAL